MTMSQLFGDLYDLFMQPAKSVRILLLTMVDITEYEGIHVLQHRKATKGLEYQVTTGELVDAK